MPQPKKSGSGRSGGTRKAGSSSSRSSSSGSSSSRSTKSQASAARKTAQRRQASASRGKSGGSKSGGGAKKKAAPRSTAAKAKGSRLRPPTDVTRNVQSGIEMLTQGVVLTRERIQEAMDDAVRRGRMTRDDANEIVAALLSLGRKQTEDLRSDIEQLLGRGLGQVETAVGEARRRASKAVPADRALREVDRAKRAAGVGRFPITGYDDLTAAQVGDRVGDLTPAELRKVRDYERRNANRKSVLEAIERALS